MTVGERIISRPSRTGPRPSVDLIYTIFDVSDETTALSQMAAVAPATYNDLVQQEASVEPQGSLIWQGVVKYGPIKPRQPKKTGDSEFSFDTGGGTEHATQSIETLNVLDADGQVKDGNGNPFLDFFKGAIGLSDGEIEGVDIVVPHYRFSEVHYLPLARVTNAYKSDLFDLTGRVNQAPFRGWAAGEILFEGAAGSKRGEEDWQIPFHFAASRNKQNVKIGYITIPSKKGWEYLWVAYADVEQANEGVLVKHPLYAVVEKLYEDGDFTKLLI